MNKSKRAARTAPSPQSEPSSDNRHNRHVCQAEVLIPASIKTRPGPERGGKKGPFYKPLATQFQHGGFQYRQIVREGDFAIYEQRWIRPDGKLSENVAYEVIRIRRREAFQIGDNFVEPAEIYPRSKAWGTDGFTLTDRDSAFNKFRQMSPGGPANQSGTGRGRTGTPEQTETETSNTN
jgi:hypothetical protein